MCLCNVPKSSQLLWLLQFWFFGSKGDLSGRPGVCVCGYIRLVWRIEKILRVLHQMKTSTNIRNDKVGLRMDRRVIIYGRIVVFEKSILG